MTVKLTTHDGWWKFRDVIAEGKEFKTSGALSGGPEAHGAGVGRLPAEYRESARSADYAVYSYSTPIAWRTAGQWITPDETYSRTTSCHQSKIFTAISQLDEHVAL